MLYPLTGNFDLTNACVDPQGETVTYLIVVDDIPLNEYSFITFDSTTKILSFIMDDNDNAAEYTVKITCRDPFF